jgi:hypothetical protein
VLRASVLWSEGSGKGWKGLCCECEPLPSEETLAGYDLLRTCRAIDCTALHCTALHCTALHCEGQ